MHLHRPSFMYLHSKNYQKIVELSKQFPNDQELGNELRKFLNSDESKTIRTIELDQPSTQEHEG